jgi:hypothetical protein
MAPRDDLAPAFDDARLDKRFADLQARVGAHVGAASRAAAGDLAAALLGLDDAPKAASGTDVPRLDAARTRLEDALARAAPPASGGTVSVLDHLPVGEHAAIRAGTSTFDATDGVAAALAAGTDVHFPPGRYRVRTLAFDGARMGGDDATLAWIGDADAPLLTVTAAGARVDGLGFDGTDGPVLKRAAVQLEGDAQACVRCRFHGIAGKALTTLADDVLVAACRFEATGREVNANAVEVRGRRGVVAGCTFADIGEGHCVRIGVFKKDRAPDCGGFVVAGNQVRRTKHGAFTCELGAHSGVVAGNHVDGADAAYKTESDASVHDVTFAYNTVANLTDAGPIDLNSPGVAYVGNRHARLPNGGPFVGDGGVCEANLFWRCGGMSTWDATQRAAFVGNTIVEPATDTKGQLITLRGRSRAIGNRIVGDGHKGIGIRVFGADNEVVGNRVEGLAQGIALAVDCTRSRIEDNTVVDCPGQRAVVKGQGDNRIAGNRGFDGPAARADTRVAGGPLPRTNA